MSAIEKFTSEEYGDSNEACIAAFGYCRDVNRPITVKIDNHLCKLFPSGRMVDLETGKVNNDIDW